MTPQEALQLVDQATGMANLNRGQHAQVVEALRVLYDIIQPKGAPDATDG